MLFVAGEFVHIALKIYTSVDSTNKQKNTEVRTPQLFSQIFFFSLNSVQ